MRKNQAPFAQLLSAVYGDAWFMKPEAAWALFADTIRQSVSADKSNEEKEVPDPFSIIQFIGPSGRSAKDVEDIEDKSIALVTLSGPMLKYSYWTWNGILWGTMDIASMIEFAVQNPKVNAIVIDIDSGGGQVSSIPPLLDIMLRSTKPIVAHCDVAASAAYYAATAADYIFADNALSSVFGSIGVVISWLDFTKYYEELGIKIHEVYAPESDWKNKPMLQAEAGNYKLLQSEVLSPLAVKFQDHVKASRPDLKTDHEGILSGRMFYAETAQKLGMVDRIGTLSEVVAFARNIEELRKSI